MLAVQPIVHHSGSIPETRRIPINGSRKHRTHSSECGTREAPEEAASDTGNGAGPSGTAHREMNTGGS